MLGASAPACTPPPEFVKREPGTLAAPFGLAFHDGYLYVGNTASLVRYKYTNGDLQAQGEPEKLMDLPSGGHSTRNIVFNRAGTKMYIAVGSQSNNDAGEDCRRAAVLEFNPDGTGYRVYASGIRNPVGLALQPGTDIVWTAINERDNLGDDLVPDYATSVKEGGFYGWPYWYIGKNYDPRYVGAFPELVNKTIVPDVLIPSHSAALGITFYTGTQFPQRYRNGGFVALHGSWNRSVASGYKVVFFPMNNGRPGRSKISSPASWPAMVRTAHRSRNGAGQSASPSRAMARCSSQTILEIESGKSAPGDPCNSRLKTQNSNNDFTCELKHRHVKSVFEFCVLSFELLGNLA